MDTNDEKPNKKGRMGRPALGDDARNLSLTFRVSKNELRAWKARAEALGISLPEFILGPHRGMPKSTKGKR